MHVETHSGKQNLSNLHTLEIPEDINNFDNEMTFEEFCLTLSPLLSAKYISNNYLESPKTASDFMYINKKSYFESKEEYFSRNQFSSYDEESDLPRKRHPNCKKNHENNCRKKAKLDNK